MPGDGPVGGVHDGFPGLAGEQVVVALVGGLEVGLAGGSLGPFEDVVELGVAGVLDASGGAAGEVGGVDLGAHEAVGGVAVDGSFDATAVGWFDEEAGQLGAGLQGQVTDLVGGQEVGQGAQGLAHRQGLGWGVEQAGRCCLADVVDVGAVVEDLGDRLPRES